MSESTCVLTQLANSGDDIGKIFVSNVIDLYRNSKEDVINVISQVNSEKLCILRIKLYLKVIEIFPELEKFELITRLKREVLVTDIYEFGLCVASRQQTEKLKNILELIPENKDGYSGYHNSDQEEQPENITSVEDEDADNSKSTNKGVKSNKEAISNATCSAFQQTLINSDYKKNKLCIDNCKYQSAKGRQKKDDCIQCHLCQHWIHPSCVGENSKDIVSLWTCPLCRLTPDIVRNIFDIITVIQQDNAKMKSHLAAGLAEMKNSLTNRDQQINKLIVALSEKTQELAAAKEENASLRCTVSELNNKLSEQSWKNFWAKSTDKTLVVGSSIVRDMTESSLDNTDIVCIRGGGIKDVAKCVSEKSAGIYNNLVLVVGGNDCDPRDPAAKKTPADIVDQYRSLIKLSKEKSASVTVSSICPRISSAEVMAQIDSVNAGLQVICTEENVRFVDNTPIFYLQDNSINDAYYLDDGIHITYKAANKLAQNLQLKIKDKTKGVCVTQRQRRVKQKVRAPSVPDEADEDNYRCAEQEDPIELSHPFFSNTKKKLFPIRTQRHFDKQYKSTESHYSQQKRSKYPRETRCYRCYENNHTERSCRHEKPLICKTCGTEGHKSKHHYL